MAKRSNIVSFEEAKAASSSRRSRNSVPAGVQRSSKKQATDGSSGTSASRRPSGKRSASPSKSAKAEVPATSRAASLKRTRPEKSKAQSQTRATASRAESSRSAERREQKRRERTKTRANRLFDKQYAAESTQEAASSENAPRAALYEGKLGSSQKKSARMQLASEAGPVSAKINPAGWFSNLNVSPRTLKVATAVICFVLVGVFLYTPAQQYYQSLREHDRLEAEYAIIEERNQVLDEQNDSLAGDAGMEDAARQKYGYVVKGDQTAVVTGLSESTTDTSRDGENIEANVLASSVKAPEEWYTPYLDAFFGVSQ